MSPWSVGINHIKWPDSCHISTQNPHWAVEAWSACHGYGQQPPSPSMLSPPSLTMSLVDGIIFTISRWGMEVMRCDPSEMRWLVCETAWGFEFVVRVVRWKSILWLSIWGCLKLVHKGAFNMMDDVARYAMHISEILNDCTHIHCVFPWRITLKIK